MKNLNESINSLKTQLESELASAGTLPEVDRIKIAYIGRSGHVAALMETLKSLSTEEKRASGPQLNELKSFCAQAIEAALARVEKQENSAKEEKMRSFDVTASKSHLQQGSLHIYTQLVEELEDIFISMGFQVVDGAEVENEFYNFDALNIPTDHPARDMHDTFWLNVPGMLMRTHTSSTQAHCLENTTPPLAIFAPGRCFRNEATDATHDFMFTQGECMVIDKKVSLSHLLATAQTFLQKFFKKESLKIRVRPGFFPFVEPGLEIDATCPFCTGGCSVCKRTGWVELLGAGLVHPNVLKKSGINPEEYQGFAFGFGIERLAMLRHKITDIRLFHSGTIDFLKQF